MATLGVLLLLAACGGAQASSSSAGPAIDVPPPHLRVPGLSGTSSEIVVEDVVKEASHPEAMQQILASSGFLAGADRTLTGGRGTFSRVVARRWQFATPAGATAFGGWVETQAAELIGAATVLHAGLPADVTLLLHEPTGCCHEEVPVYLAVWQRGHTVWTVRASGMRIHTAPVVALVRSITKET